MRAFQTVAYFLICLLPQISFASKPAIPEVLKCETYLSEGTSIAGFISDRVSSGDMFYLHGTAYVTVKTFMGGGGSGHGPHDRYADTFMVEARPLGPDLTYNPDRAIKKFTLASTSIRGNVSKFYVIGKMSLKIADGQDYVAGQIPRLQSAGYQLFTAAAPSLKIGTVILHPDLNGFFVLVEADEQGAKLLKLDPELSTYSESAFSKYLPIEQRSDSQIKITGAIAVGYLNRFREGQKPAYYKSWETFQKAYAEKPVHE